MSVETEQPEAKKAVSLLPAKMQESLDEMCKPGGKTKATLHAFINGTAEVVVHQDNQDQVLEVLKVVDTVGKTLNRAEKMEMYAQFKEANPALGDLHDKHSHYYRFGHQHNYN